MHIADIWCIASRDAVFQHNEVARVRVFDQPAGSMAFDVDMGFRGTRKDAANRSRLVG